MRPSARPDMPNTSSTAAVIDSLLDRHGQSYAEELGLRLERNTPGVLFRWLCASLLLSARIRADTAISAARALVEQGWTTAQKMARGTWVTSTRVLNRPGYARYDERTARMLGDTTTLLIERYRGDLRRLRAAADQDPQRERALLKEFKGIGDVGADIFFREMQLTWDE